MKNYIVTSEELIEKNLTDTNIKIFLHKKVNDYMKENYKENEILLNIGEINDSNLNEILREEIENNRAEKKLEVIEYKAGYQHERISMEDKSLKLKEKYDNHLYHFREYDLELVCYHIPNTGVDCKIIYAKSYEKAREFMEFLYKKDREDQIKRMKVFTNTGRGLVEEIKDIKRNIDRKDVYMDKQIKNEIYRMIDTFFDNPDFYRQNNIPYKRGVILYGKPGNGKTTLIKSLISSLNVPVVYFQVNEYTNSESITKVFERIAQMAPAVLVIEDIDSMPSSCRSVFLNILDGANSKEGIFMIGTTNYPEKIDEGIMNRSGRFDSSFEITKPNLDTRKELLTNKIGKIVENTEELSELTDLLTLAQLFDLTTNILLKHHYGETIDPKKMIEDMKKVNDAQEKQTWNAEVVRNVGFH